MKSVEVELKWGEQWIPVEEDPLLALKFEIDPWALTSFFVRLLDGHVVVDAHGYEVRMKR